jgi:hypothetical protein
MKSEIRAFPIEMLHWYFILLIFGKKRKLFFAFTILLTKDIPWIWVLGDFLKFGLDSLHAVWVE